MSYAANFAERYHRAAYYVDKILKGIKPAELPVEQPIKFELIINLIAAKQIGLTIPPNVLVRADKVIRLKNAKRMGQRAKGEKRKKTHEQEHHRFSAWRFALSA